MKKFLFLLFALLAVVTVCGCKEDKNGAMTYEEYVNAELDSEVVIEAYIQAAQVYSASYKNTSLYLQDKEGAYFVYRVACTEEEYAKFTVGTKVRVTGTKSEWSGEVEITDAKVEVLKGKYTAKAKDVTKLLGTDELIKSQNQFVSFEGLKVEASKDAEGNDVAFLYKYNGSGEEGDDLYFNVSYEGKTYQFLVESDLCNKDSEVYKTVKGLSIGDVIDLEGFLYWYNGANPHITKVTKK